MEWEYNTVKVRPSIDRSSQYELNKILNEQGEEGWELVSTVADPSTLLFILSDPESRR